MLFFSFGSVHASSLDQSVESDPAYQDLIKVFSAIEALPDSVIAEGDDAVAWLKKIGMFLSPKEVISLHWG